MGEQFPGSFESDFDSFDDLYNEIYSDGSEQNEALREQTKSELVEIFGSQQFQYGSHIGTVYDIVEVCPHIREMLNRGAGADAIASEIAPFAVELRSEEVLEIEEPELDIPAVETMDANDTKSAEAKSGPDTPSSAEKSQVVSTVADAKSESPSVLDSDVVSGEKSDTISLTDSVDRAGSTSSDEQSLDDYGGDVIVAAATHESLASDAQLDKQVLSRDEKVTAEKPVKDASKQLESSKVEAKSNPDVKSATIDADANKQDTVDSSTQDIKSDLKTVESIKATKQRVEIVNDPMESEKPERFVENLDSKQVAEIQTVSVEALDIPDKNRTQTIEIDDTIRETVSTEIHYAHETEHEDVTQSEHNQAIPEVDEAVELYEGEPVAAPARDIAASELIDEVVEIESVEPQDHSLDFEVVHDEEEIDHIEPEEFHERDETEFEPVELEPEFIKEVAEDDDESDDSLVEELLSEVELDPETIDLETEIDEIIEDIEQLNFADEKLIADDLIELQINADEVDVDPGVELETMHSELAESIDSEELDIEPVPIAQVGHEIVEVLDITLDQETEYLPKEFHRSLKQFEQNIAILKQATSAEECNDSLEAIRASLVEILDALGCYDSEVTAKYLMERHTLSELHELLIRLQKELTEKNRPKHISTSQLSSDIVQLLGRYVMSSYRKVWAS